MKKTIITSFISSILMFFLGYGLIAFILDDWNIHTWGFWPRFIFVMFCLVSTPLCTATFLSLTNEIS